jgi:hypothetical protein
MPSLRCSDDPPELELSGTPAELRALGGEIASFAESQESSRAIALTVLADTTPYNRSPATLNVTRTEGPTRVSLLPDGVQVAGSAGNLQLLAKWFAIFEDDTPEGYHVHYDGLAGNEYVAEDSIELIIIVERRPTSTRKTT